MKNIKSSKEQVQANIYFVDPMSYNNLAIYDYSLLSKIKGVKINFFCNNKYDYKKLEAINFNPIFNYTEKKGLFKLISYLVSQFTLLLRVFIGNVSIIHFQWFKIPLIDYIFLHLFKLKSDIVFTAHNVLPHDSGKTYFKIYKKIYKKCDAIIVHSPSTKIELIERLNVDSNKIHVIPHGTLDLWHKIDKDVVDDCVTKFKSNLDLNNKLIFSSLGSINNYKGIDLIVEAWRQNNLSSNDKIKLIIAGKGEDNSLLDVKNQNNAAVINRFLSSEEFLALLKLSDFVLLPYRQISQSGILLTALNEKKKVIVSNVGGLKDPFEIGNIGFVLDKLNADELNKVICKAIEEKDEIPSESTWNQILNYYDWAEIGIKTSELYSSLYNKQ